MIEFCFAFALFIYIFFIFKDLLIIRLIMFLVRI